MDAPGWIALLKRIESGEVEVIARDLPAPSPFAAAGISEYMPNLSVSTDGTLLLFKRSFYFGGGGTVLFPVESYGQLKSYFDMLHKQDNHNIALKQTAATN